MKKITVIVACGMIMVGALLTCGCSRSDLHVVVGDARGVAKGSPVIWQETYVGEVSSVKMDGGCVRIDANLQKAFRKSIHAGAKACPMVLRKVSDKPALFLIGGKDTSLPLLAKGSRVPEATLTEATAMNGFWGWLGASKNGKIWLIGCVLAIIVGVCAIKLLAGVLKFALLVGAVLFAVYSSKSLRDDWETYKASFDSSEVKQWFVDHVKELESIRNVLPNSNQEKEPTQK